MEQSFSVNLELSPACYILMYKQPTNQSWYNFKLKSVVMFTQKLNIFEVMGRKLCYASLVLATAAPVYIIV